MDNEAQMYYIDEERLAEYIWKSLLDEGYTPETDECYLIASFVFEYLYEHAKVEGIQEVIIPNQVNDLQRLYEELQKQEVISFGLKRRITSLRGELRYERQEKAKLLKELKDHQKKDHYRNGQKRGRNGRNG